MSHLRSVHFNSSMVRLRANEFVLSGGYPNEFQFQYGSIERKVFEDPENTPPEFQFQYGSIERTINLTVDESVAIFQFQYGSIESFLNFFNKSFGFFISIPVWFD